jgi:hypothetical protein
MANETMLRILSEISDAEILCNCGKHDIDDDKVKLTADIDSAIATILLMQLDPSAVQEFDKMLVAASRVARKSEISQMRLLHRCNAFLHDSIGISIGIDSSDKLRRAIHGIILKKEIKIKQAHIIRDHIIDIVECYCQLCEHDAIDGFPLISVAYRMILLGHLPYAIQHCDGNAIVMVY